MRVSIEKCFPSESARKEDWKDMIHPFHILAERERRMNGLGYQKVYWGLKQHD
jgi:hypothetical protein